VLAPAFVGVALRPLALVGVAREHQRMAHPSCRWSKYFVIVGLPTNNPLPLLVLRVCMEGRFTNKRDELE
jgi:hypothetical protein